jgi:hypothetical protein
MSKFKQVVIDFLVSKLPVIYHPLSKNIGKNNTTHGVSFKATYVESTDYFNMYSPFIN